MKRLLLGMSVAGLLLTAIALSRSAPSGLTVTPDGLQVEREQVNPWNNLRLNNDPTTFRFAIASDRTGGPRAGVFERAITQLNLLQPEFVVCVGDLIDSRTEDLTILNREWKEFNGLISRLEMPFFYCVGNHDIANQVMARKWQEQFGRSYYHFVYKNVLFLMLNSEDPPVPKSGGRIGKGQIDHFRTVLAANTDVRWTLVFLHRPAWTYPDLAKTGWLEMEQALTGRRYSVFAGHKHTYVRSLRNGQKYFMLATTGGESKMRGPLRGEFDHLVWVTMKRDGPVLANLMMEGIFPEDIHRAFPPEE